MAPFVSTFHRPRQVPCRHASWSRSQHRPPSHSPYANLVSPLPLRNRARRDLPSRGDPRDPRGREEAVIKIPGQFSKQIAAFPAPLRKLIEAELKAGNAIVELSSCFPAPPAGAYVKLAKPVSTRARKTSRAITYYDRNASGYSGEFTDAERFYFVLEPPRPPEPPPDMNALRAQLEAKQRAADAARFEAHRTGKQEKSKRGLEAGRSPVPPQPARVTTPKVETAVDRFRESMVGTYERWHDGIGYDVALFETATPDELVEIENLLLSRSVDDWRDVEALASLDSPRARVALRKALQSSNHRVRFDFWCNRNFRHGPKARRPAHPDVVGRGCRSATTPPASSRRTGPLRGS